MRGDDHPDERGKLTKPLNDVKRRFMQSTLIGRSALDFQRPAPQFHSHDHGQHRSRMYRVNRSIVVFLAALVWAGAQCVSAQGVDPRFGVGANALLSTADGLGIGVRGRASAPINADLSLAADLGLTAFILGGRRNADYIFDPQVSLIVSLPPSGDQLTYLLFGMGGYIPVGDDDSDTASGPTIHGGFGWVRSLQESSLFYEINPALVIREEGIDLAIPFRIGVIF